MTKLIDSLYIHFPFCLHLCNYCDFFKRKSDGSETDLQFFHQFLEKSFSRHERLTKELGYSFEPLKTLYLGGGTPSLWGESGARFLKIFLEARGIKLATDCEFTMEVNPKAWTIDGLSAFEDIGVNRYSLGVQTLNSSIIPLLDRYHNVQDVFETLEHFSKKAMNFSIDFMLGLPRSQEYNRNINSELKRALEYNPQHFSVYILTVKDNYKHYDNLPDEDWIHQEFIKTAETLTGVGFEHYEVSNFSLPGKASQHNQNYWKSQTVAALGASATGFLNPDRLRYKWKTVDADIEIEHLTEKEFFLEKIYMGLRSSEGISRFDFKNHLAEFDKIVSKWNKQGLVKNISDKIVLNSEGFIILDSLMADLYRIFD